MNKRDIGLAVAGVIGLVGIILGWVLITNDVQAGLLIVLLSIVAVVFGFGTLLRRRRGQN